MHLLLTDETNRTKKGDKKFFVYGGLIVPLNEMGNLNLEIEKIRKKAGYKNTDTLKFDTNARPDNISVEEATEVKKQVVQECIKKDCRFIVHIIHHKLLKNQNPDIFTIQAADYVIGRFNIFLREKKSSGICIMDRLSKDAQFPYMKAKFTRGLVFHNSKDVPLDRIHLFASSVLEASHLNSAADIILGSFRYCINNPKNSESAGEMMKNVMELIWKGENDDIRRADDHGFIVRPQWDKIGRYLKNDYTELVDHINGLLIS